MDKTVKDWVKRWKTDCGTKKDPGDRSVVIKEDEEIIYEGHPLDIPEKLYERPIVSNGCIVTSSVPGREGAYILEIEKEDLYLKSLYNTLEMCDLVLQNSQVLPDEQVVKAQKLRKETQESIQKREAIPVEKRL